MLGIEKNTNKNKKSSKFKGIYWHTKNKIWYSKIMVDKKSIWLGCFSLEIDAAKVYNEAAIKYFGEFANINKGL